MTDIPTTQRIGGTNGKARKELIELLSSHLIDDDWDCRSGCDVNPSEYLTDQDAQEAHYADILLSSGYIKQEPTP